MPMRSLRASQRLAQRVASALLVATRRFAASLPSPWRVSWFLPSVSVAVLAAMVATTGGATARAQVAAVPAAGFTADWHVKTLAVGPGNVLYLGGEFGSLAQRTGHWVRFDAAGARAAAWAEVD